MKLDGALFWIHKTQLEATPNLLDAFGVNRLNQATNARDKVHNVSFDVLKQVPHVSVASLVATNHSASGAVLRKEVLEELTEGGLFRFDAAELNDFVVKTSNVEVPRRCLVDQIHVVIHWISIHDIDEKLGEESEAVPGRGGRPIFVVALGTKQLHDH